MNVPIRWQNLGAPTESGDIVYRDVTIEIRAEDIAAVADDAEAVVHVAVHVSGGRSRFRIVSVEHSPRWLLRE